MISFKVKDVVINVLNRAVRNCNWIGDIWGHRLRIGVREHFHIDFIVLMIYN